MDFKKGDIVRHKMFNIPFYGEVVAINKPTSWQTFLVCKRLTDRPSLKGTYAYPIEDMELVRRADPE